MPAKNAHSHPHDALQYLQLGGGEADVVMNRVKRRDPNQRARIARDVDYPMFGDRESFGTRMARDVDYNPFSG